MGKTQPTYRDRLDDWESEWEQYRRALQYRDQEAFDQIMEYVHSRSMAGGAQNARDPRWTYWMAVAIAQERRLNEVEAHVDELSSDAAE